MRVFRPNYRDRQGKPSKLKNYYVEIRNADGIRHKVCAFSDQRASQELGRKLETLVALRLSGQGPDAPLARWLETLPLKTRERLAKMGFIDVSRLTAASTVNSLLDRMRDALEARDRTKNYIDLIVGRARRAFEGCKFSTWSDLDGLKLERHLRTRRTEGVKKMSSATSNHVLAACKQFTGWCIEQGLAASDPFATLRPVNARLDPKLLRRALSSEELSKLIDTTQHAGVHRHMAGPLRAIVYRLAAETGLRANEIQSLRAGDLDLNPDAPQLSLPASATKNRQEARIPLRADTARELAPYLRGKLPTASALPLPKKFKDHTTRWLKHDLEAAGIDYIDPSGRVADFHALRVSYISRLSRSNVHPRLLQTLARHSDPRLTLGIYAKLEQGDERNAIEALPSLAPTVREPAAQKATGTGGGSVMSLGMSKVGRQAPISADVGRLPIGLCDPEKANLACGSGGGGGNRTRVPESLCNLYLRV